MARFVKLLCVGLIIGVALPAFAQITPTKAKKAKLAEVTKVEEKKTVHREPGVMTPQFPERFIGAAPTLGFIDGKFAFGAWGNVLFKASETMPLWVGGETGIVRASGDNTTLLSIPLMGTAIYQFAIPDWTVRPYAGGSLGFSITRMSSDVLAQFTASVNAAGVSTTETKVYFELLARGGVKCENFFFEARMGVLKDLFVFMPTAGYVFEF